MVRGWILVQTESGRARVICDRVAGYSAPGVRIVSADTVTGPHDIIVQVEADDLDDATNALGEALGDLRGIERVTTCVVMG